MKILWLVNIVMPELAAHLGEKATVFGGWLNGAMAAVKKSGHKLVVCTTSAKAMDVSRYDLNNVVYYVSKRSDTDTMRRDFKEILDLEKPDVIHLYGTEFEHSWAMASISDPNRTLVSIQGLVYTYADHVYAGIPDSICRTTFAHRILKKIGKNLNSIESQRMSYLERSSAEINTLKRVRHVNGGTAWGDGCSRLLQPDVVLHQCGLILRDSFYGAASWDYDSCEKYSIFTIYTYPIKGFHKFLEALRLVVAQYPDTKVYVAGNKCAYRKFTGLKKWIMDRAVDYDWYVQNLIEEYGLKDNLVFLGFLNEEQMREMLLQSHVFVSASAIENHSTALGEAMASGVPSVASCVGGLQEMIDHGRDGFLYPFDETYMLAHYIMRIFEDRHLAERFSKEGRAHALRTYNREENCRKLLQMYETVLNYEKEEGM